MVDKDLEQRRFHFPFSLDQSTRWLDNDQYGHLNNSVYPLLADSINNTYLIDHCGIEPTRPQDAASPIAGSSASVIGLVISSSASFYAPCTFPNRLKTGLRVIQLGSSSVTYEVGVFEIPPQSGRSSSSMSEENNKAGPPDLPKDALASCILRTTHVFVDRITRRPVKPMPKKLHEGLSKLKVERFMLTAADRAKM